MGVEITVFKQKLKAFYASSPVLLMNGDWKRDPHKSGNLRGLKVDTRLQGNRADLGASLQPKQPDLPPTTG